MLQAFSPPGVSLLDYWLCFLSPPGAMFRVRLLTRFHWQHSAEWLHTTRFNWFSQLHSSSGLWGIPCPSPWQHDFPTSAQLWQFPPCHPSPRLNKTSPWPYWLQRKSGDAPVIRPDNRGRWRTSIRSDTVHSWSMWYLWTVPPNTDVFLLRLWLWGKSRS